MAEFTKGLQITVLSFKEVCKFLLQQGIPYIISERLCHGDLENYFGKQRAIGRRSDKNQFLMTPIGGNVQGPAGEFNEIYNGPMPKQRK